MPKFDNILLKVLTLALTALAVACTIESTGAQPPATVEPQAVKPPKVSPLVRWVAGEAVTDDEITAYGGVDRCFTSQSIPDSIVAVITGCSHPAKGAAVALSDLRYVKVLHRDADGATRLGELVCNRLIADDVVDIMRELYDARYPIERMTLVDNYGADDDRSMAANNSSAYNCRKVKGKARLSRHAYGMAVDINPLYNPHVKFTPNGRIGEVEPVEGRPYADRQKASSPYMIKAGDPCHRAFTRRGFKWGGAWRSSHDYQHFQR